MRIKNKRGAGEEAGELGGLILVIIVIAVIVGGIILFNGNSFFKNLPFFGKGDVKDDVVKDTDEKNAGSTKTILLNLVHISNSSKLASITLTATNMKEIPYSSYFTPFLESKDASYNKTLYFKADDRNLVVNILTDIRISTMPVPASIVMGLIDSEGRIWFAEEAGNYWAFSKDSGLEVSGIPYTNYNSNMQGYSLSSNSNKINLLRPINDLQGWTQKEVQVDIYLSDLKVKDIGGFRKTLI